MIDFHYDLLMFIYINRCNINYIKEHIRKIYNSYNITGGILNIYFMSYKEMKDELNIDENEIDVIRMLRTVTDIIIKNNLLKNRKNFVYGIEGCDYLKIEDLGELYNIGARSIGVVWNNDNVYGTGAMGKKRRGLTKLGIKLIKKAIDLGIAIDLSHTNEKTFNDIIRLCIKEKNKGKNPIVIASHSNAIEIDNKKYLKKKYKDTLFIKRGLSDEQLLKIKLLDGYVGIVMNKKMLLPVLDEKDITDINNDANFNNAITSHIKHIENLFGNLSNICIATDDLSFLGGIYNYINNFNIYHVKESLKNLLKSECGYNDIDFIMRRNALKLIEKLK